MRHLCQAPGFLSPPEVSPAKPAVVELYCCKASAAQQDSCACEYQAGVASVTYHCALVFSSNYW